MQDGGAQIAIRDDPETAVRSHRREARDRLLDHGLLAVERQQLLGPALATQRPEARAAATGQNHRIEMRIRLHSNRKPTIYAREVRNLTSGSRAQAPPHSVRGLSRTPIATADEL